jgi:hypothetical protein
MNKVKTMDEFGTSWKKIDALYFGYSTFLFKPCQSFTNGMRYGLRKLKKLDKGQNWN